jgi:hypothetical protein
MAATVLLTGGLVSAQEALHVWMANDAASEARRVWRESPDYTFKVNDFSLLVASILGAEWNDNVNLDRHGGQQDIVIRPALQLAANYPFSQRNGISLNATVGYDKYLRHDQYSYVHVGSGSELASDIYAGDFWINLHDRFQYFMDSGREGSVANLQPGQIYGGFQNLAGTTVTWDLNQLVLSLGYDHLNFISSSSAFDYLTQSAELLEARAGLRVHPRMTVGVEGTAQFTDYSQRILNDNVGASGGLYADWQPSSAFRLQARSGYAVYLFDQTSQAKPPIPASDQNAWYVDVTASDKLSDTVSVALSTGHELRLGLQSDSVDDWYFRPNARWDLGRRVSLLGNGFYEHGRQDLVFESQGQETYDWYGAGVGLNYQPLERLTAGLNYRVTFRSSSISYREYTQNLVALLVTYTFK